MNNKSKILILCLAAFLSGNAAMASDNTTSPSDNKICSATSDLMKEVIKQTVYTVGNTVLQKYANPNGTSTFVPSLLPTTTTTPGITSAPSASLYPGVGTSTTTTAAGNATVTPSPQGDVIIIK